MKEVKLIAGFAGVVVGLVVVGTIVRTSPVKKAEVKPPMTKMEAIQDWKQQQIKEYGECNRLCESVYQSGLREAVLSEQPESYAILFGKN